MKENLAGVRLVPHTFGEAGGGATEFIVPADRMMTFSRLFHREDSYQFGVEGNFKEELKTLAQLLEIEYLDYDLTERNL